MARKLSIRLISPWSTRIETRDAVFSVDIPSEKADALLCEWSPSPELFTFPRRKAWYCCEPQCQFQHIDSGSWPKIKAKLKPSEFLFHNHVEERFRVPHITHFEPPEMNRSLQRKKRAIAIVSNHGGPPHRRHPDITYRNRFITAPQVDLFGRASWRRYRPSLLSFPKAPKNYCGEIPGDWPADQKRKLQASYKVAVCLENMNEPCYFTEKFVEAAMNGCIPIYRAAPTVKATFLQGASWIDPADFGNNAHETLEYALSLDIERFHSENASWARSLALGSTNSTQVFEKIAKILLSTLDDY
jgi:hypothetical protein